MFFTEIPNMHARFTKKVEEHRTKEVWEETASRERLPEKRKRPRIRGHSVIWPRKRKLPRRMLRSSRRPWSRPGRRPVKGDCRSQGAWGIGCPNSEKKESYHWTRGGKLRKKWAIAARSRRFYYPILPFPKAQHRPEKLLYRLGGAKNCSIAEVPHVAEEQSHLQSMRAS